MEGDAPSLAKYFDELLREMNQLNAVGQMTHATALLNEEIQRVWGKLFNQDDGNEEEPEPPEMEENPLTLREKIAIPDVPGGRDSNGRKCNLIGRILGPSGLSVKQLEAETDCQILIRGKGSVKDPQRQARLRGTPGWEHLDEPLHVVVTATDSNRRRAVEKLNKGVDAVRRLLEPSHDEYKRRQLVQLAIINGTYRIGTRRN